MALLEVLLDEVVGYLTVFGFLLAIGVLAAICWAPFLLSKRVRELFAHLPPFTSPYLTYGVVGVGAAVPYLLGLMGALAVTEIGSTLFTVVVIVSAGYLVAIPLGGAVVLPRVGVDWDSTGYGVSTWALLFAGAVWYTTLFAVPLTIIAIIFSLP
jgi:hypothetical protein